MLTVYSLGFFLYPYKVIGGDVTGHTIMAPSTPDHLLWVGVKKAAGKPPKNAILCPGWSVIPVPSGTSISFKGADSAGNPLANAPAQVKRQRLINGLPPNPNVEASWANFDLIPDVSVFFDKAALRTDLTTELYAQIPLALGGELTSVPDRHTLDFRWTWESGHRQAVSALGRYRVDAFKKGVLTIGATQFELGSDAVVVFLHVPPKADGSDRERYDRGVDHHMAMMKICEAESRIEVHNPLDNDRLSFEIPAREFALFAEPVLKCARGDKDKTLRGQEGKSPRDAGYPSCSSRRIRL
jgi:hypothetical protein